MGLSSWLLSFGFVVVCLAGAAAQDGDPAAQERYRRSFEAMRADLAKSAPVRSLDPGFSLLSS